MNVSGQTAIAQERCKQVRIMQDTHVCFGPNCEFSYPLLLGALEPT